MSLTDLPVLTGLTALALGLAVLHLEDGSSVTVGTEPKIWLSSDPPFVLALDGQHPRLYAVPDHLHATVRAALNLHRIGAVPLVLILIGIERQPDAVTFQAVNQDGQAVALSVARPVFTQIDFTPSLTGPVDLSVTREEGRGFRFEIQPETPEGSRALELLVYGDQLQRV